VEPNATTQEWERRRRQYKDKMRSYNRLALWTALPCLIVVFIASKDIRPVAFLAFIVAVMVFAAASTIFSEKYLRCPNCGFAPGFRGQALNATVCDHCHTRLTEDLLPPS
jgi:hypothetical protein